MSKILESLFAHKLIKLVLIQCNANLSYTNTVDEMYYNSSIVPTCMLFFSMPPTSIIFLVAVPQPLESRTVPVCKEKFCKQAVEIWSYLPNGELILFRRENSDLSTEELYSMLLSHIFYGQVEMIFGLVHASYSLPKGQAIKLTFLAPTIQKY